MYSTCATQEQYVEEFGLLNVKVKQAAPRNNFWNWCKCHSSHNPTSITRTAFDHQYQNTNYDSWCWSIEVILCEVYWCVNACTICQFKSCITSCTIVGCARTRNTQWIASSTLIKTICKVIWGATGFTILSLKIFLGTETLAASAICPLFCTSFARERAIETYCEKFWYRVQLPWFKESKGF